MEPKVARLLSSLKPEHEYRQADERHVPKDFHPRSRTGRSIDRAVTRCRNVSRHGERRALRGGSPHKANRRLYRLRFARHSDSGAHWWIVLVCLHRHLSHTAKESRYRALAFPPGTLPRQEPDATLQVSKARIRSERIELRFDGQLGYLRIPFCQGVLQVLESFSLLS